VATTIRSHGSTQRAAIRLGGLGVEQKIDAELVIPDKDRTLRAGAIAPWAKSSSPYYTQTLQALGKHYRFTLESKWKELPKKTQDAILYGSGDDAIKFTYDDGLKAYETKKPFEGVITNLERRWRETESEWAREELAKYFTDIPCNACEVRLKPEALCVKIGGKHVGEISDLSVKRAGEWFTSCRSNSARSRTRSPCVCSRKSRWPVPGRCRVGISHAGAAPARFRAAASAFVWPRRSARGLPVCSMCWMSRHRLPSTTTRGCSKL
jgi:excinuclease UvrABC ATPase subunit